MAMETGPLRDQANEAFQNGNIEEALRCFVELEHIENDPEWARRAAQAHHHLGNTGEEVEALNRAARRYIERGEILKAAVMSKLILALHPQHIETLRRIPELVAARDAAKRKRRVSAATPESGKKIEDAIGAIYLRDLMPGADLGPPGKTPGVREIPLPDQAARDQPLELSLDGNLVGRPGAKMGIDDTGNIVLG